jgi:hypothetical protein
MVRWTRLFTTVAALAVMTVATIGFVPVSLGPQWRDLPAGTCDGCGRLRLGPHETTTRFSAEGGYPHESWCHACPTPATRVQV